MKKFKAIGLVFGVAFGITLAQTLRSGFPGLTPIIVGAISLTIVLMIVLVTIQSWRDLFNKTRSKKQRALDLIMAVIGSMFALGVAATFFIGST